MAALRDARKRRLLIVAAALITVNWGLYIWSVNNDHVVDASLGYFITPFISVVLGTTVLGERLRNAQKIAIATPRPIAHAAAFLGSGSANVTPLPFSSP